MSILECHDVSFAYDGIIAVKGINFAVTAGDYLCIVGENGAGKSTLMKGILRLLKPAEGTIKTGDGLKASEIGYLPQQTDIQKDFPASVNEVVLSGCLNAIGFKPFFTKKENQTAAENMERLGITAIKDKCYRDLSGGQQQRVLLARALCSTHKMLLLDEPVAGLDPVVTQDFYELIKKINQDMGITIIMISHDIYAAVRYAKHILHLSHEQLFFGTSSEYLKTSIGSRFTGGLFNG